MNNILSEVKKPLTERGWNGKAGHEYNRTKVHAIIVVPTKYDAEKIQAWEDQPLLIARIEALEAERRWIPVQTIPATRNKGDYVKNCSEWFLLLFDDGEVCKGWYQDGVWYRREAHTNLATPCDPTDYQAFPQEVKA